MKPLRTDHRFPLFYRHATEISWTASALTLSGLLQLQRWGVFDAPFGAVIGWVL